MVKRHFSDEQKYGLTEEEVKTATKYLRKHKTAGALTEAESLKLFELYLIGSSFTELANQFPQYPIAQIIMTAALRKWAMDRDKMMHTLRDRVKAKVVKSVIEQVDFLTTMLSVSNAEHLAAMQRYINDPVNNPKPDMRVQTIKEYKDVAETLYKIVAGSTPGSKEKTSPMFDAMADKVLPTQQTKLKIVGKVEDDEEDAASIIEAELADEQQD